METVRRPRARCKPTAVASRAASSCPLDQRARVSIHEYSFSVTTSLAYASPMAEARSARCDQPYGRGSRASVRSTAGCPAIPACNACVTTFCSTSTAFSHRQHRPHQNLFRMSASPMRHWRRSRPPCSCPRQGLESSRVLSTSQAKTREILAPSGVVLSEAYSLVTQILACRGP